MRAGSVDHRQKLAKEAFGNAADAIGPIVRGMNVFAITRGQFSMIDAILHTLDSVGPSALSLWTWCIAEYEVQVFERLMLDRRITSATLVIDQQARTKNASLLKKWVDRFGESSIRIVVNHAKIATVESQDGKRVTLRGSMNLNFNPRFEQLDVSEGGPEFELIRGIEQSLILLPIDCTSSAARNASNLSDAFDASKLSIFSGAKVWAK